MSNDLEMSYNQDPDGRVMTSDVLVYGNSSPTEFTWTYDPDGYLTEVTYESKSGLRTFRSLFYESGNLIQFRNTMFSYDDASQKNHPDAPDVVWGYMSVLTKSCRTSRRSKGNRGTDRTSPSRTYIPTQHPEHPDGSSVNHHHNGTSYF